MDNATKSPFNNMNGDFAFGKLAQFSIVIVVINRVAIKNFLRLLSFVANPVILVERVAKVVYRKC